jgi:NAD(P)-dependent dehydrogenase (short-subunit alcohol dehydrogenase family)
VEGLTNSAALEALAYGVRVNAVAPGPIETPMIDRLTGNDPAAKAGFLSIVPAGRIGTPEEVAQTILAPGLRQGVLHHGPVAQRGRRADGVGTPVAPV